jgi:hypothetical protein
VPGRQTGSALPLRTPWARAWSGRWRRAPAGPARPEGTRRAAAPPTGNRRPPLRRVRPDTPPRRRPPPPRPPAQQVPSNSARSTANPGQGLAGESTPRYFFPTAMAEAPRARSSAGLPPYPRL